MIDADLAWLQTLFPHQPIRSVTKSALTGGYVAAGVYRLDVQFDQQPVSLVQKYTTASEVRVMRLLARNFKLPALPALVADRLDNDSTWFASPFYAGQPLTFDDDLPPAVIQTLAVVHARYTGRTADLNWLPKVDGPFIRQLIANIFTCLAEQRDRLTEPVFAHIMHQVQAAHASPVLAETFNKLPKTLVHGDVHPGNVIQMPNNQFVLFDWGNARIAPAMLDLANMVNIDSPEWQFYLREWAAITGLPLHRAATRRAYYWSTAIVNLQYLPFAITQLEPSAAAMMSDKVADALGHLT